MDGVKLVLVGIENEIESFEKGVAYEFRRCLQ